MISQTLTTPIWPPRALRRTISKICGGEGRKQAEWIPRVLTSTTKREPRRSRENFKVACIPSPRVHKQQEVRYNQVLEGIPRSHILDFFCGGAAEKKTLRPTHTWTTPNARRSRGGKLNTRPDPYMHRIHVKQRRRLETKVKESRSAQGSPRVRRRRYLESKRRSVAASPTRQRTRWAYLDLNSGGAEAEKTVDQTQGGPISGLWGWAAGGGSDRKGIPGTKVSVMASGGESSQGRLKV